MTTQQFFSLLISLIAITNAFGNAAIFLSLTKSNTLVEQRKIALSTALAVAIIALLVICIGSYLLAFFGISVAAFRIAGGFVIFSIGFTMLQSKKSAISHTPEENQEAQSKTNIAVVPLAIPIVGGPGMIANLIVAIHAYPSLLDRAYIAFAALIACALIALVFYFASDIAKVLGRQGINILTRIMGLILMSMAVSMLLIGLGQAFPGWLH